jgi:putative ABC transport system permease protein
VSPLAGLRIALQALRRNALRSLLAMLGIIIGVGSVIALVAIGSGAREVVDRQIRDLGSDLFLITSASYSTGGRQVGLGSALPFSERDLEAIRQALPEAVHVTGYVRGPAQLVAGPANWSTTVFGVAPDYLAARAWSIQDGRDFAPEELRSGAKVVILGYSVAEELFPDGNAVGSAMRIMNVPFRVVGVLAPKGQSMTGYDQDDLAIVPITTARRRLFGGSETVPQRVQQMMVAMAPGQDMAAAREEMQILLRDRRRIRPGVEDDFWVRDMAASIRARTATQTTLGILLGVTAGISLLVGGIGIMNIMLVSVTERTREIGLRMAVGARRRDIRVQFLIEAMTLCVAGGAIGVALGVGGTILLARFGALPVVVDGPTILGALLSSALVGTIFGFYPARRASHLNPIDALRHE